MTRDARAQGEDAALLGGARRVIMAIRL